LKSLDPYERSKLCDTLQEEHYKNGDKIIVEGTSGNKFYIIEEGTAIATKKFPGQTESQKVFEYSKGMYFGERALLTDDLRAANVIATSDMDILSMEREAFTRVLGSIEYVLRNNMEVYNKINQQQ
jgi:cAMP-dependent protein kinase regulator